MNLPLQSANLNFYSKKKIHSTSNVKQNNLILYSYKTITFRTFQNIYGWNEKKKRVWPWKKWKRSLGTVYLNLWESLLIYFYVSVHLYYSPNCYSLTEQYSTLHLIRGNKVISSKLLWLQYDLFLCTWINYGTILWALAINTYSQQYYKDPCIPGGLSHL